MTNESNSAVERRIGSLDPGEFAEFVAEIWTARDWSTVAAGSDVVATSPHGETRRIRLIHDEDIQQVAPDEESDVDVVVTNSDGSWARGIADRLDARYVGPETLREMLRYAVDPDEADRLISRYFDQSVDGWWRRRDGKFRDGGVCETEEETDGDGGSVGNRPGRASIDTTDSDESNARPLWRRSLPDERPGVALVLLFGLFVLVALVFVRGPLGTVLGLSVADRPPEDGMGQAGYPPGIDPDGITNLTRLTRAHRDAVDDRSYTLVMSHDGSRGVVVTHLRWNRSRQRLRVDGPDRYVYRVNGTARPKTIGGSRRRVAFVERANGGRCLRHATDAIETQTPKEVDCRAITGYAGDRHFAAITERYLRRFLDTDRSRVEPFGDTGSHYRILATGTPTRINRDAENYRAIAVVDGSGFVRRLRVTYTLSGTDGPTVVEFEFRIVDSERRSSKGVG